MSSAVFDADDMPRCVVASHLDWQSSAGWYRTGFAKSGFVVSGLEDEMRTK